MGFVRKFRLIISAAFLALILNVGTARAFVVFSPSEFAEAIKRAVVDGIHSTQLIKATTSGNELLAAMGQFNPSIADFIKKSIDERLSELAEAAGLQAQKLGESVNNKWNLSGQPNIGFTETNEYIFPTPFAVFCEFSTDDLKEKPGIMEECMRKILKLKANPNHEMAKNAMELMSDAFEEEVTNAISSSMITKNEAAMHEKEVLIPQREQSAKATTERDDIEVLNMSNMEAIKTNNKTLKLLASSIAMEALRSFRSFEITDTDLTEVDQLDGTAKK